MSSSYNDLLVNNYKFFGMMTYDPYEKSISKEYIVLFNRKFKSLLNEVKINDADFHDVYNFIKNHDDMFELLESVKSMLNNYFENCPHHIRIAHGLEYDSDKLLVVIKINNDDSKQAINKLININSEIRPLKKKLGLIGSFLINVESI